ncbi:MAG: ribonuclease HII [Clostridia bacterium]|nr:ribonuclease HII [Clostridia bacterium]
MKEKELERLNNLKKRENEWYNKGLELIAGIDEAGRGPLAGPVVVACCIMPKDSMIEGVNDSKKIAENKREKLYEEITSEAISYGVGIIGQTEIDEINILQATKKGLTIAIQEMEAKLSQSKTSKQKPDLILVDALTKIDTDGIPYQSIIHGDALSYSIACASIIAKVTRDRMMRQWDEIYPQYGFSKHKGYGTAAHIQAIREYGPCTLHRKTFIKNFV